MTDRTKKIFFGLTVVVPIMLYCAYYYGMMIKNAPYRFSDFQYIHFEYGVGDSLVNKYDSRTGIYQYQLRDNSIKTVKIKLNKDDLLYLHRKAADLGFWNFPPMQLGRDTLTSAKAPHYLIEFVYKEKSKKVIYDESYEGDASLKDANMRLVGEIQKKIEAAERNLEK